MLVISFALGIIIADDALGVCNVNQYKINLTLAIGSKYKI
jgi:hypothetical protein